jgi:hypothetical protein
LFEHTIIDDLGKALDIDRNHLPNLADVGALLGATDIFPNLGAVLRLDKQPNPLDLVADGFKQAYEQAIDQPERTISDLGAIKTVLSYSAPGTPHTRVTFVLDPIASPRWCSACRTATSMSTRRPASAPGWRSTSPSPRAAPRSISIWR